MNPEDRVLDAIDALVDEALVHGEPIGGWVSCPKCHGEWHGQANPWCGGPYGDGPDPLRSVPAAGVLPAVLEIMLGQLLSYQQRWLLGIPDLDDLVVTYRHWLPGDTEET